MPQRPARHCPIHGPYPPARTRCPRCVAIDQARIDRQRGSAAARGYDWRWRTESAEYLAEHPVCQVVGCHAASEHVDHIDGLGPLGPRGYDRTNWRALCAHHHGRKTAAQSPGGWNQ